MFIVYDDKGMIRYTISGPDPKTYGPDLTARGEMWLFEPMFTGDIVDKYVDGGKIKLRPKMTVTRNGKSFRGIPKGSAATVMFDGQVVAAETVNDGKIDLAAATPGTYQVLIECWPYLPKALEVTL